MTPRYHRADERLDEVARTRVAVAAPGGPVASVHLSILVDAGVPLEEPRSPSHQITTTWLDERRCVVRLVAPRQPTKDFVVRYRPRATGAEVLAAAWRTATEDADVVSALFVPPARLDAVPLLPTEYVFLLDRSGSMTGEPIAQARNALRACLRTLGPGDAFRILVFDDRVEWYGPSRGTAQPLSDRALAAADRFLAGVEGRGGTELVPALQAVLGLRSDPERRRVIVLLTDGAVSAEDQVAGVLAALPSRDRLFCFGIGPAVNRYLLDRIARIGRGVAEVVGLDEDIEGAIIRFQDRLGLPVLTDLTLEALGAALDVTYPTPLPDLYAGQALRVVARLKPASLATTSPPRLVLRGLRAGETVTVVAEVPPPKDEPLVARQWGRARLDALLEATPPDVEQIVALSRRYHLLTPFTALLAVDRVVVAGHAPARPVVVPGAMPEGVTFGMARIAARSVQPAAPARLLSEEFGIPAFLRRSPGPSGLPMPVRAQRRREAAPSANTGAASSLPALMRAQRASGAWGDSGDSVVETALALVAFARAGQTPTRGSFRRPLYRALAWLRTTARRPEHRAYLQWVLGEIALAEGEREVLALAAETLADSGDDSTAVGATVSLRLRALIDGKLAAFEPTGDPWLAAILGLDWAGDVPDVSVALRACLGQDRPDPSA